MHTSKILQFTAAIAILSCTHQTAIANYKFLTEKPSDYKFLTEKPFDLTVTVNGATSAPIGYSNVDDLFRQSTSDELKKANPHYTNTSAAIIRYGYRGTPMYIQTLAHPTPIVSVKAVTLFIPELEISKTFDSKSTRNANVEDLKQFLRSSGGDILNKLQQLLAKTSPVDPIAGNPGSMQSRMLTDDFDHGFTQLSSNIKQSGESVNSGPVNNLTSLGMSYGNYSQAGFNNSVITLPLAYTFRPDMDPRRQLTIHTPITVTEVAGAKAYSANIGVSYRLPINDDWSITPAVGYSLSSSPNLGSAAAMLSASLTSQYTMRMPNYDLAFGNMIGLYNANKFKAGDYSFEPNINNTVFRNGAMVSFPTIVMGRRMSFEISYINTILTGTDLYSNRSNEIGITLGTNKSANSARSYFRAGVNYLKGEKDVHGFRLNLGYWF